jgi:hypothetical protein
MLTHTCNHHPSLIDPSRRPIEKTLHERSKQQNEVLAANHDRPNTIIVLPFLLTQAGRVGIE